MRGEENIREECESPRHSMRADERSQHLMNTYKRSDMIFTHGRGCYVYDQEGKKYLDFLGGIAVNALGYSYPRPGEDDPARGGPRGSRLESVSQSVSRAAGDEAREVVGHGPRIFLPTAAPKRSKVR